MSKRIVYIHGNDTYHWSFAWAPWLKTELEKLGFETFGSEYRFRFSKKRLSEFKITNDFFVPLLDELDDEFLKETITLRPATPFYCLRTATEFRSLLTIP